MQLTRRCDLDWLRVLAVLLLVPYHSAIIFSSLPQTQVVYVYDSQHGLLLMKTVDFMYLWHMPLLFVVAGAASWFALGFRSGRRYLGERVDRLLVPLLFGMIVLLPPTLYLWTRTVPRLAARFPTFFQFYPHYFVPDLADLTGRTQGSWTPQHLWFILYLLGYSALALPIFQYLRGPSGKRLVEGLAAVLAAGLNLVQNISPFWLTLCSNALPSNSVRTSTIPGSAMKAATTCPLSLPFSFQRPRPVTGPIRSSKRAGRWYWPSGFSFPSVRTKVGLWIDHRKAIVVADRSKLPGRALPIGVWTERAARPQRPRTR